MGWYGDTPAKFYEVRMKYEYVSSKIMERRPIQIPQHRKGNKPSRKTVILENGVSALLAEDINEEFKSCPCYNSKYWNGF